MSKRNVTPDNDLFYSKDYSYRKAERLREVDTDIEMWEQEGYVEYVSYHRSIQQVVNGNGRVGRKPVDY